MIASPDGATVLSSMGWVEKDALWRFDTASGAVETLPLNSGAAYCSLHANGSHRFAVVHHFEGHRFEMTVRDYSSPHVALARVVVAERESALTGDAASLSDVPPLYVAYLGFAPWHDYVLVELNAGGAITIHPLPWYDATYDKGYQAIIDAVSVGARRALISVQRSSRLIVQDLESGGVVHVSDLGGGLGNPRLTLRPDAGELWTTDYDAVAVLRIDTWKVRKRRRLQDAAAGSGQFIGDLTFAPELDLCLVPRPFSGDVVGVSLETLKIRRTARLGRQPLQAAALAGGDVIARDWKTGDLLRGTFQD